MYIPKRALLATADALSVSLPAGLTEELVDCSGGEEVSLETGTRRKLEALEKVRAAHVHKSIQQQMPSVGLTRIGPT